MQLCELEIPARVGRLRLGEARVVLTQAFDEVAEVLPVARRRTLAIVFAGEEQLERWAAALEAAARHPVPSAEHDQPLALERRGIATLRPPA